MRLNIGNNGEPIPAGTFVLRVCKPRNMDADRGIVHPGAFELSAQDRMQTPPKLSVFLMRLTSTKEALKIASPDSSDARVAYLMTDMVRKAQVPAGCTPIDIVWDELTKTDQSGNHVRDVEKGAAGHSGIINTDITGVPNSKLERKRLRTKLAELSTFNRPNWFYVIAYQYLTRYRKPR